MELMIATDWEVSENRGGLGTQLGTGVTREREVTGSRPSTKVIGSWPRLRDQATRSHMDGGDKLARTEEPRAERFRRKEQVIIVM